MRDARNYCVTRYNPLEDNFRVYKAEDTTFPGPGQVGLWSRSDAQTGYDDLTVTPAD